MEWDFNTPWYRPTRVCQATSGSDFGWRNGDALVRYLAIIFAVAGGLEILHALAALEPSSASS